MEPLARNVSMSGLANKWQATMLRTSSTTSHIPEMRDSTRSQNVEILRLTCLLATASTDPASFAGDSAHAKLGKRRHQPDVSA